MKKMIGEKIVKKVSLMIAVAAASMMLAMTAFAQPAVSVTADKPNVQPQDIVTVTVKASDPEDASVAPQIELIYDPAVLEYVSSDVECGGGGGMITLTSTNANIQFKTIAQGNANVQATLSEDGQEASGSTSIAVGTAQNANLSSDATLRALSVTPGTMAPSFSPAVTEYTIVVDASVTDITVSGGVTDENAQITAATGFKNLEDGENHAIITVTAQDGSSVTYNFNIVKGGDPSLLEDAQQQAQETETEAAPETTTATNNVTPGATTAGAGVGGFTGGAATFTKDGITYQISQGFDTSLLPQGCLKADVTVQGHQVQGVTFDQAGLTIVYAISGANGTGNFYIYDAAKDEFTLFVQIPSGAGFIIPIGSEADVPNGFVSTNMQWDSAYLPAYQAAVTKDATAKDFYLLYAVNENGEYGYYLYDAVMGTCQRYVALAAGGSSAGLGNKSTLIIGIMAIVIVGLLMLVLNQSLRNKELTSELSMRDEDDVMAPRKKKVKKTIDDDEEDDVRIAPSKESKKKKVVVPKKEREEEERVTAEQLEEEKRLLKERHAREQRARVEKLRQQEMKKEAALEESMAEAAEIQYEEPASSPDELGIQITAEKAYEAPSEEEIEKQKAIELAKEEKKKAARKAALEREIQRDEKARAKQAAAEKKAMEKLLAAEQKLAARQSAKAEEAAKPQPKKPAPQDKEAVQTPKQPRKVPGAKIQAADPSQVKKMEEMSNTARMRTVVKKEVTDRGVTYTTGKIPVEMINGKEKEVQGQVPIFTLEKRTVTLTREPLPDEIDDDFEFEFINLDED